MSFALTFDYAAFMWSREENVTLGKGPRPVRARVGDRLGGKYVLRRRLGEGGMGTVFAAMDETLGRDVAIKLLHARGMSADRLFKAMRREARALAALDHPNIVRVIEAGTADAEHAYLVMELVEGTTLRQLSDQLGPIEVISSIAFAQQLAGALDAAHGKGILHCDMKPDNVLVSRAGRIKVTDFGLARHVERGRLGTTDQLVEGCGTPHYMAPELFLGRGPSVASDVYALGATMIELLTGKYMFSRDSVDLPSRVEVREMHLGVEPDPIEATCGPLVAPLGALIRSMIAKDARERPTAEEVAAGLRYEHMRLRRHFPEEGERGRDTDDEDEDEHGGRGARRPSSRPAAREVERALAGAPEEAPLSARVMAFVTAELPASFVPKRALPRGFEGYASLERAETVPADVDRGRGVEEASRALRNVTEPMPGRGVEEASRARRNVTEAMPGRPGRSGEAPVGEVRPVQPVGRDVTAPMPGEATGGAVLVGRDVTAPMPGEATGGEVRGRELPAHRAERAGPRLSREVMLALRMDAPRPAPGDAEAEGHDRTRPLSSGPPQRSGDAVTVSAERRAARPAAADGARDGRDAPGMLQMRPMTLAAIGFAVLSVGLLSRDLIQQFRRTEEPAVTAAPLVTARAAPVVSAAASAGMSLEPVSAAPAAGIPSSAAASSVAPASGLPAASTPSAEQRPSQRTAAPGFTGKTTGGALPPVLDPWAKPSRPTSKPSPSPPGATGASSPKPGIVPEPKLPFGKAVE